MVKILLVDDEAEFAADFRDMATEVGDIEVEWVSKPSEVEPYLSDITGSSSPDVCFVDYNLNSEVTGTDLVKEIRLRRIGMPLVVLSHRDDQQIAFEAHEKGATLFFNKGELINAQALEDIVKHAFYKNASNRENDLRLADRRYKGVSHLVAEFIHDVRNIFVPIVQSAAHLEEKAIKNKGIVATTEGLDPDFSDKINYELDRIIRESGQLLKKAKAGQAYLSNFNDFAESGLINLSPAPVVLSQFIHEYAGQYFNEKRNVEIIAEDKEGYFDQNAVGRILQALFVNIEDHLPLSVNVVVSISIQDAFDFNILVISVRDYGPGVPEDKFQTIFEPGVMLDQDSCAQRNKGLGLAIAKKFAEQHSIEKLSGQISCGTPQDGGCIFQVKLPIDNCE